MGFMSPGLGFASGVGAFIGGAAKQINENIDEQRKQDRQDDILWLNRFERGLAEHEKEKKEASINTSAYNSFLKASNGNKKAADLAMQQLLRSPKDFQTVYENLVTNHRNIPNEPDYQSNMLETLQSGTNQRLNNLQNMYDTARPQAKKFMVMPGGSPGGGGDYGGGAAQQAPMGSSPTGGPASTPNYSQGPNGQPDPLLNNHSTEAAPIQPAANQGAAAPSTSPNGYPIPPKVQQPPLQVPGQQSQAVEPDPNSGHLFSNPNKTMINKELMDLDKFKTAAGYNRFWATANRYPNDPSKWDTSDLREPVNKEKAVLDPNDPNVWDKHADRPALSFNLQRHGVPKEQADRIAAGAITAKEKQEMAIETGKTLHPNAQLSPMQVAFSKEHVTAKLDGELSNASDIVKDAQKGIDMIESGQFKSSALQPMWDTMNRYAVSLGITDLQDKGIANPQEAANLWRKIESRLQFSQIPNYHLGRWTQMEVQMLGQQIASGRTDENTNVKILLLMKATADRRLNYAYKIRQAMGGGQTPEQVNAGMDVDLDLRRELSQSKPPWTSVNLSSRTPETASAWNSVPSGGWIENASPQSVTINGKIVPPGGMIHKQ